MKNNLFLLFALILFLSCNLGKSLRQKEVDKIMQRYQFSDQPGASLVVMKNGKILFQKGYGVANIESKIKIDSFTNFRLASVTKQFTAMSILLLEKRGLLKLSDSITKYFPDFPSYGKSITIKNLLTHSSGLVDYEDLMPTSQSTQLHDKDCLQLMYTTDSLYFQPGTDYRYSNTGYALLALIVQKVSGQPFSSFLYENIFKPLNMSSTIAFDEGKSMVSSRAMGHSFENGKWIMTDQSLTSAVLGDGGIYSNAVDMSKWIQSLFEHRLISTEKQEQVFGRTILTNGKVIDYGLGWHVEDFNGKPHPYHDGSSIGFRNSIVLFPEQKLMVLVLTNRNEHDPKEEAMEVAKLYLGQH